MAITKRQLDLAGWCSITNALIAIPSLAMSWFLDTEEGMGPRLSQALLTVVGLGLFLYVISSLRKLLNIRFKFHDVDSYISLMIWGNIALASLSLFITPGHYLRGRSRCGPWGYLLQGSRADSSR